MENDNRRFYRKLDNTIPVILQNLLINSLTFADTLMIGQLGTVAIAAVGLANQLSFLINLFFFGLCTGSSIFLAQFYGSGNEKGMRKMMGLALLTGIVGAAVFCLLAVAFPSSVLHIFTDDLAAIELGADYLRYIGISFFFAAFTQVFSAGLRSTGKPSIPLITSIVSMCTNILLNWLLIFGVGPFPRMGVEGAALATTISRGLETFLILLLSYRLKNPCAIKERDSFVFPKSFLKKVVPVCIPVICNEFFWALGMSVYKIAYAKNGIATLAAVNVNEAISNMFFTVMFGISTSSLIMIGQKIGQKEFDEAKRYCVRFCAIALIGGVVMGSLQALFAPMMVSLFDVEGSVLRATVLCLYANALLFPIRCLDTTIIVGILRSGGDTRFSMLCELSSVWLIGIPMAFLGCVVLKWDIWHVYLLVGLEEVVKGILGIGRIKSGKWLNDLSDVR